MSSRRYGFALLILSILIIMVLPAIYLTAGLDTPPAQPEHPLIVKIQPDTAASGDTVSVMGRHFGARADSGRVVAGGKTFSRILLWSDTLIHVVVSDSVVAGSILVLTGTDTSNAMPFMIAREVSFSRDVKPILKLNRCLGCHGGTEDLYLDSVSQIMEGADDGAVVIPGKADSSLLIKKLSENPPFGKRMPLRGPYLPDSQIQIIKDWINQGAKDN